MCSWSDKLDFVDEVRDLGFRFGEKLCFYSHYKSLQLLSVLYLIFSKLYLRAILGYSTKLKTYVRPISKTGTTVFPPYEKKDIDFIESVQN